MTDEPEAPRKMSAYTEDPHYHPSCMRVGIKIDGVEQKDITSYDMDAGVMTRVGTKKWLEKIVGTFEAYWRYPESRQQRRARERWEASHRK